ncbi:unnamed protein product [Ixodes hexagonus]
MSDELSKPQKGKDDTPPTPSTSAAEAVSLESTELREDVLPSADDCAAYGACGGTSDPVDYKHFTTQRELDVLSWVQDCSKYADFSSMIPSEDHPGMAGASRCSFSVSPWAEDCLTNPCCSGRKESRDPPTGTRATKQPQNGSSAGPSTRDEGSQCFNTAFVSEDREEYIAELKAFIRDLDSVPPSSFLRHRALDEPVGDEQLDDVNETLARLEASFPEIDEFVDSICGKSSPEQSPK